MKTVIEKIKGFFKKKIVYSFLLTYALFLVINTMLAYGVLNNYYVTILVLICISVIMATSLNVATGFLGQLHLGHAGFMAIGAYVASIVAMELKAAAIIDPSAVYVDLMPDILYYSGFYLIFPSGLYITGGFLIFLISAFVAMIFSGIAGILVGTPALRLRGDYLGIMTLGFGEIVKIIITNLKDITGGAQGLYPIPRIMTFPMAFWTAAFTVATIWLFMNSRHGRAILSIREDEIASESVGIKITNYKILGFVIASMFGGLGGAVLGMQVGFLSPGTFNFIKSVEIFVIVVLGGMGSLTGGIIAAVVLTYLPEALREFDEYRMLIYSFLLIVVMLYRPKGLMGTKEFSIQGSVDAVVNLPGNIKKSGIKTKDFFKKLPDEIKRFFNKGGDE